MLNQVSGLIVGRQYVLSTFMGGPETGGSIAIDVGNYGGQAWYQTAGIGLALTPDTTDRWHFAFTTFTADNTSMMVRLVRNGPTIPFARNYFDDVAITEASTFQAPTVVPEPTTLAVLGAGTLAFIRRRRAK
ncbi:MAG: PEP-CTERM sorting domain-containing protein [Armatimonadetes bacterium]|nr:PEP-CTERM sorting domain-containing protein [Armatimonadota bacterium]